MARIRTIKPDFWSDLLIGECSPTARLLFIACWNFADDHGGLDRSAKQLKAQAFPYDAIDCEPLIQELLKQTLLIEYAVDGKKFLHIKNFKKHQRVEKPASPRIPVYEESENDRLTIDDESVNGSGGVTVSLLEGNGREGNLEIAPEGAPRKTRSGSRIPDNFSPDLAYAKKQTPDIDAEREAEKFCDYWRARAGKDALKADWPATWRTWVRNGVDRGSYARASKPAAMPQPIFRP